MKSCLISLGLAITLTGIASAQTPFETSLSLREQTREAARVEDWHAAQRTNNAALALQPGHPGLLNNAIILANRAGDNEAVFDALQEKATRGLGFDLSGLSNLYALRQANAGRLSAIETRLARNVEPVGDAREVANPPLADALIEALAVDSETERLYLGSVADRRIYLNESYAPDEAEIFAGEDAPIGSIFGLAIDRMSGRLYAAEGFVPQTPLNDGEQAYTALLALDMDTGEIINRYTIEGAERMGDVVVRDGAVYVSDAQAGRIYRLPNPSADLEVFAEDDRFSSLQGLVATRGAVYVADYALGIWRIDPVTRQAHLMATPDSASFIGLDGMDVDRAGRVYVVRNGAAPFGVFELTLDTDGTPNGLEPVLIGDERLGEPTTVRLTDGRAFVIADAPWALFPEDGSERESARPNPVILAVGQ